MHCFLYDVDFVRVPDRTSTLHADMIEQLIGVDSLCLHVDRISSKVAIGSLL